MKRAGSAGALMLAALLLGGVRASAARPARRSAARPPSTRLKTDLAVKKVPPGGYWLRFALVDLLGFELPFSRPTRIIVR